MGGAGAVAVGDGRQQLHVGAENLRYGLLFSLAQFRKLFCHMGNRAVMLTYLYPLYWAADPGCGGGVTGSGQRVGDALCRDRNRLVILGRRRRNAGQDGVDTTPRERPNRFVTADLTELPHRGRRQIVVGVLELGPPGRGESIAFSGSATAGLLPGRSRVGLRIATVNQSVEVPAHARRGNFQAATYLSSGDGSRLQKQSHDGAPSAPVLTRQATGDRRIVRQDFHNTSVTQLGPRVYQGHPHLLRPLLSGG